MAAPPDLPTGTVTFLFTDLETSTRLLEADPAAYRAALRRHHDLLRAAVEAHGGAVFETVGDAAYAAFACPTAALAAALAGQLALHRETWGATGPLRARMGVHLGEVERHGARYFGLPLVRCARLTAAAHGGQVVLSAAVAEVAGAALPPEAALRDLGAHRLKDLPRPEHVWQLRHPALPGEFPPLRADRVPALGAAERVGPGSRLGPYQLLEPIGRGSVVTLYRAFQPALARYVAVKVLDTFRGEHEQVAEWVRQEAAILARLRHPNVVTVFDYGEDRGLRYLVVELIDGEGLEKQLGRPLPVERVVGILTPVAAALDYLHSRGMLHGDVKPANILLARDGAPVLVDLALAAVLNAPPASAASTPGRVYGSPPYMAPERARGGTVTPAADVYALAVVAFEMLTGRPPFSGDTPLAVLRAHVDLPPPRPREVNPGLPPYVEAALLKGLAKRPDERYGSATEFVRALSGARGTLPAAPADLERGARFGAYRIVARIASGGVGTVYRAHQAALGRDVAVKVLHPHVAGEPEFQARFRREALAVAQLRHPNVLAVFDYGQDAGMAYIVSELVDGGTLADHVGQPLAVDVVVQVLAPVAAALDYAHARGVVHRDVKPANILLTREGTPVLGDFGLAKLVESTTRLTETGAFFGTPHYMAPEQITGDAVGPPADQYALAVVAYELLAGRVPFAAETPLAVLHAHVHTPPPPLHRLNPALTAPADAALRRGLAKRPEARFASASALIRAIEAAGARRAATRRADGPRWLRRAVGWTHARLGRGSR
jgi:serine/threonine protein kinase/class 3 adenylate cyclase